MNGGVYAPSEHAGNCFNSSCRVPPINLDAPLPLRLNMTSLVTLISILQLHTKKLEQNPESTIDGMNC